MNVGYSGTAFVIFVVILELVVLDALLISGTRPRRTGENSTSQVVDSSRQLDGENSILTEKQGITLKELRKLARLSGHESPEVITEVNSETCYKDDCLEAAKEFYVSMDFSEVPCRDWGRFACEWRTLTTETAFNQHATLAARVENQVREILMDRNIEEETIQGAQSYFDTCLQWFQDFNRIDHITSYLESVGNWPILSGKPGKEDDWVKILIQIMRISPENVAPLVFKLEAVEVNNQDKMLIEIGAGSTSWDFGSEDVTTLLRILRKNQALTVEKQTDEIREMHKCMQTLASSKFDTTQKSKVLSLTDLQNKLIKEVPELKFNVLKFIQGIFDGTDLSITSNTKIVTDMDSLVKYVKIVHSLNPEALLNILFFQLTNILIGDTTNMIEEKNLVGMKNYKRVIDSHPNLQCLKETTEVFSYALAREYVHRFFKPEIATFVSTLIDHLKIGFDTAIKEMSWLEKPGSDFVRDKVKKMDFLVGTPSLVSDEKPIDQYYKNVAVFQTGNFNGSKAYLNYRSSMLSWLNGKYWKSKLEDDDVDGWNYRAKNGFVGDVNVEYIPSLNQMRIPAGIMQQPLFGLDSPGFMNYGGLGSIIAREMSRAFDSNGIYVSADGEAGNWLDEKSYKSYIDWTMRLRMVWDKNDLSLNDKIVNVLGYHITVNGYEDYLKGLNTSNTEELKLPGLSKLTPGQLLQLKYTNVLCESSMARRITSRDGHYHPSSSYGLFPVTRNMHFGKLFECEMDAFYSPFDLSIK